MIINKRDISSSLGLSSHEIVEENKHLQDQIKQITHDICVIKDLLDRLDQRYEESKQVVAVQRYKVMKDMIKTVINDKVVRG